MAALTNCPSCGAPLPNHTSGQTVTCSFCGIHLTPEALGEKPAPPPESGQNAPPFNQTVIINENPQPFDESYYPRGRKIPARFHSPAWLAAGSPADAFVFVLVPGPGYLWPVSVHVAVRPPCRRPVQSNLPADNLTSAGAEPDGLLFLTPFLRG